MFSDFPALSQAPSSRGRGSCMGSGMVRPGDGEWALCGLCWSQFSVPDLLETRVTFLFEVRTSGWGQSELPELKVWRSLF